MFDPTDDAPADDYSVLNDDGTKTYTLAFPRGDLDEVTLRRPIGGDYLKLDGLQGVTDTQITKIALLSGLDGAVITGLDMLDVIALDELWSWFEKNPAPGAREVGDNITNPDGSVTVPLTLTLKANGEDLTEISLRRVGPADMKAGETKHGINARSLEILCRITDVGRIALRQMDCFDYARINAVAADFLQKRPPTGARRS